MIAWIIRAILYLPTTAVLGLLMVQSLQTKDSFGLAYFVLMLTLLAIFCYAVHRAEGKYGIGLPNRKRVVQGFLVTCFLAFVTIALAVSVPGKLNLQYLRENGSETMTLLGIVVGYVLPFLLFFGPKHNLILKLSLRHR